MKLQHSIQKLIYFLVAGLRMSFDCAIAIVIFVDVLKQMKIKTQLKKPQTFATFMAEKRRTNRMTEK